MMHAEGGFELYRRVRRAVQAVALFAVWAFAPAGANAQRLWSVGEVSRAPEGPAVVMEGVAVGPDVAGLGGAAPPRVSAEVQVTYDYLRLGFGFLELPLPDGSVIEAENAVFEDRGGGNLMWTGEVPGAGYESVLFTVQDRHLVGWFGEPGGPKYVVHAGPDGRGTVAEEAGPAGDWCGVGSGPAEVPGLAREAVSVARGAPSAQRGLASAPHGAPAADPPRSVASAASGNSLDILVLYTTGTERFWRVIGGPAVGLRRLGDYLNMVFRNGAIPATANLIGVRWDPELRNHPSTQGNHFVTRPGYQGWHDEFHSSTEVGRLVARHKADLVHFVPVVGWMGFSGRASLRTDLGPWVYSGWSVPYPGVFAHEIGHNLGGGHDPPSASQDRSRYIRPYAFGHTDLTSCRKREGRGDSLACPATVMSYGTEARTDGDSSTYASGEPFYSSVRHKPNGWTIGVAGERENERVFHETVRSAMSADGGGDRVGRGEAAAEWIAIDTARVMWTDSREFRGGVDFSGTEGWSDSYVLSDGPWLTPVREGGDGDGRIVGVEVRGLRPGGKYRVATGHNRRSIQAFEGGPVFGLEPPRPAANVPVAPSNVALQGYVWVPSDSGAMSSPPRWK